MAPPSRPSTSAGRSRPSRREHGRDHAAAPARARRGRHASGSCTATCPGPGASTSRARPPRRPRSSRSRTRIARCTSACCSATPRTCCGRWPLRRSGATSSGGLNTTRRGDALLADVRRADCQMILVDGEHAELRRGARPVRRTGRRRRLRRVGRVGRRRRPARAARRGRRHGHVHDDLHVGHQRRAQGGAGPARLPALLRSEPGRPVHPITATTSATSRCRCSTPTRSSRAGRSRPAAARPSSPAAVLGLRVPRRRPPLRRDVHELRRQAARLRPGHPGAAGRRRQPAARRVRQRGRATATSRSSRAASAARSWTASAPPSPR